MKMFGIIVKANSPSVKSANVALVLLLSCSSYALPPDRSAETPTIPSQAGEVTDLKIIVIKGEGAINNVKQRTARELIVQVNDRNNRPVAGAVVMLTVPAQGAGGTFAGNQNALSLITNSDGRVTSNSFEPNNVEGSFDMQIKASSQERVVTGTITQTNSDMTSTAVPSAPALTAPGRPGNAADLKIIVIDDEGALNNVKERIARELIVQVNDRNNSPVAGALVTVTAPGQGAGGTLAGSKNVLSLVTGNNGRVAANTFGPHNVEGTFNVQITASSQGRVVTGTITQTNAKAAAPISRRKWMTPKKAVLIGAAVAAGVVIALAVSHGGYTPPSGY